MSYIKDIVLERFPDGANSSLISSICGGSADVAIRLYDEKIFSSIVGTAKEIKSILRGRGTAGKSLIFQGQQIGFVITVLLIYTVIWSGLKYPARLLSIRMMLFWMLMGGKSC